MHVYGAIEAGGTKWICSVGSGPDHIIDQVRFPTTTPDETLGHALTFFRRHTDIAALGIGSFGPIDVHRWSPTWGYITRTPKPGWQDTRVAGLFAEELGVPVGFDTDVNGAALGEGRWGAAQGLDTFVYITVGTGIGGGAVSNGHLVHGLMHPEMGHMRIPRDPARDAFTGACPFHGDCLEGLAAGPALAARWGQRGETLPDDHPAWELEAHYLALGLVNIICTLSPQRCILGGGVMDNMRVLEGVRRETQALLAGYISMPEIIEHIDTYIVTPKLGGNAGTMGALVLAEQALRG